MFHDMLDYHEEYPDYNRINAIYKADRIKFRFKNCKLDKNYFGKGYYVVDEFNRKKEDQEFEDKFEKTKHKIKLIVFRNGFILNNGPFRDRSLRENHEFLKSVERGNIPQEFIRKGIKDLGILLINRRGEIYRHSRLYRSLPTSFDYIDLSDGPNPKKHVLDEFFEKNAGNLTDRGRNYYSANYASTPNIFRDEFGNSPRQKEVKLFVPFEGKGKVCANANIGGFGVNKDVHNYVDLFKPISTINIILFNGEIIKDEFNSNQMVRDIYLYVRRMTGSNNFELLEGTKPIKDFEKTIGELKLDNALLTQKINIL